MHRTLVISTLAAGLALCAGAALAAPGGALPGLLEGYRAAGAGEPDADRGAALWIQEHPAPDGGAPRSCTSCHPADQTRPGRHQRTGEDITPLSPRVEPTRLSDAAEVEKWLGRNCRWTLGRECTPQEKADLLQFIAR